MRLTLPDWLIIGAAKSGTTALHAMALRHPRISGGRTKEPRYFGSNWDRDLAWYAEHYADCPPDHLLVDASVEYTLADVGEGNPMAGRIARVLPWARLVYIARDPIERIASNVRMMRREDYFEQNQTPATVAELERVIRSDRRFLDRSRYWWHLSQYREHFPDERILALVHDDLETTPEVVMQRLYAFLDLPPHTTEVVIRTQVAPGPRRRAEEVLGPALADELREELRADSQAFLAYTGAPVDLWD